MAFPNVESWDFNPMPIFPVGSPMGMWLCCVLQLNGYNPSHVPDEILRIGSGIAGCRQ